MKAFHQTFRLPQLWLSVFALSLGFVYPAEPETAVTKAVSASVSLEQQLLGRETAWRNALLQPSSSALEQLYSPKLTYLDWNGTAHARATLIADVQSGKLKYTAVRATKEEVKIYLNTALYTCQLALEGNYDNTSITRVAQLLHVWVKEGDTWQLVVHQTQKLPS